jgi:hypothetical protein
VERKVVTLDDIELRLLLEHVKPHYDWIRHVVSLCTGSLTLLVSLQTHYVPKAPRSLWLLALCWLLLAGSVFSGLVPLRAEDQTPLDAAKDVRRMRRELGDEETAARLTRNSGFAPRPIFTWARRTMIMSFSAGIAVLTTFAILNLGR